VARCPPTVMRLRQILKGLGSLKLAVALLTMVAAVLTVATFYEARTSTQAVTTQVYRSWWFNVLLGALALNLAAAAAVRWPWTRRQIGFVVTHAGLILILGGCGAAFHFGAEGMMALRVGEPPRNMVQRENWALIVVTPDSPQPIKQPLRVGRRGLVPVSLSLPGGARLAAEEVVANSTVQTTVTEGNPARNPAIQLSLGSASVQHRLRQWLLAHDPEANRAMWGPALVEFRAAKDAVEARELTATTAVHGLMLRVVILPDDTLQYVASSRAGVKNGTCQVGDAIQPGWMDVQVRVEQLLTNAVLTTQVMPLPQDREHNVPALRVSVYDDGPPRTEWLPFGQETILSLGGKQIHAMFAWDMLALPFTVTLEDFVVERDEGGQNIAGWTSKVLFTDPTTGRQKKADIWMNHPAIFHGYKFSQASWDPNDLKYTVLQVKKDPMWVTALTWGGSALTILGIGLMFYARRWV